MKTEEMDCGSFFDNIDDFLDVPNDDEDDLVAASSLPPIDLDSFPGLWSDVMTGNMNESSFPCSDSVFSNSDISAELSVPYEDIVQLEWLSSFVGDSFSAGDGSDSSLAVNMPVKDSPEKQWFDHRFRMPSPVSVLDSISSCSTEKTGNYAIAPSRCGRARTKRPRPTTANLRRPVTTPPLSLAFVSPASENSVESCRMIEIPNHNKKKKKIKFTLPAVPSPGDDGDVVDMTSHPIRKCQHCEITKTPQWRAGPMGPKTLCNACGVRYKSGRLFPEYRPAASPTFVPTVHSNSHKKVLEMRNKTDGRAVNGVGWKMIELIPNSDYV